MKLKHLFPNMDLAEMLVKNWEYDDLGLFKYWRISANAIFPFKNKNDVYMLRFAPEDEKSWESILAELHYINYLRENNYKAIEIEPSKNSKLLEIVNTPWGKYYAAVFPRVAGEALGDIEITDEIARLWGSALAKLHRLSQAYVSGEDSRWDWKEQMAWIFKKLEEFPGEKAAFKEAEILKEFLGTLPITEENYGMVHYDFELDNVFYDSESNTIIPIDFDDCMYNWYALDIDTTLSSIDEELEASRAEVVKKCFFEGYRSEKQLTEEMLSLLPVFHRYHELYSYVRVLVSSREQWENEPEWMIRLRKKLESLLQNRSREFGDEIKL